jgi:catechol 2,3-dioxygenase-like lactoylglutathione lyase family enzyme
MSATAMNQTHAKLPARDVERARVFYADKLNLTPFGEHDGHLYYRVGGPTSWFTRAVEPPPAPTTSSAS